MRFVVAALVLTFASPALACIWDRDTLRDEQRGLPSVAAVLAGRWEQHSDLYYEQRLTESRQTLAADPADLAAADDLAVALERLGRHDEAIAAATEQLARDPDRYETLANLGTFHLHRWLKEKGRADLEAGIEHIRRAIEINPDAHFGREKYQLQLAERVRDELGGEEFGGSFVVPTIDTQWPRRVDYEDHDYLRQMAEQERLTTLRRLETLDDDEMVATDEAITGVVGMIRFGTGTSPRLYEALGDLLAARGDRRSAIRAYLLAIEFGHLDPEALREAADSAAEAVMDDDVEAIATRLGEERAAGAAWVAAFQAYEDDLLRRGEDVTDLANFASFYAEHGEVERQPPAGRGWLVLLRVAVLLGLAVIVTWRTIYGSSRRGSSVGAAGSRTSAA
jgi:tetratricopeptide (TPR) repeat protein